MRKIISRRSLRSREGERKAGHCQNKAQGAEEYRRTQGWRRSRQVAMPGKASGDARLPSAGSCLKASLLRQASKAPPGQSRFRRGQFRFAGRRTADRWEEDKSHPRSLVDRSREKKSVLRSRARICSSFLVKIIL